MPPFSFNFPPKTELLQTHICPASHHVLTLHVFICMQMQAVSLLKKKKSYKYRAAHTHTKLTKHLSGAESVINVDENRSNKKKLEKCVRQRNKYRL